jgi:DNA-binding NarL/FixJ family response regulator
VSTHMIRTLLVDDHALILDGLCAVLEKHPDIDVIAAVRDGREAVRTSLALQPHVVVMDLMMPGLNGIEATRQILAAQPAVQVLCLSMHTDKRFVAAVLDAGASGYILKEYAQDELLRAIRTVAAQQVYLSPGIAGIVVHAYRAGRSDPPASPFTHLTVREREVLQLVAEGHDTKEIAVRLYLSVKTIGTHREHLMDKLQIRSLAGLIKYAIREGLTSLDT